jgi:hypothetical protein
MHSHALTCTHLYTQYKSFTKHHHASPYNKQTNKTKQNKRKEKKRKENLIDEDNQK